MKFLIKNEDKLIEIVKYVLNQNKKVIFLNGDLGAGKTTFTKYLAKELGIKDYVSSPTFILHSEYLMHNKQKLHHIDLYRLDGENELEELKLDKLSKNDWIVIEWADKFSKYLAKTFKEKLIIDIQMDDKEPSVRVIKVNIV